MDKLADTGRSAARAPQPVAPAGAVAPELALRSYLAGVLGPQTPTQVVGEALSELEPIPAGGIDADLAKRVRELALSRVARQTAAVPARIARLGRLRAGCAAVPGLLAARASGHFSHDDSTKLYRHLDRCPDCAALTTRFDTAEWQLLLYRSPANGLAATGPGKQGRSGGAKSPPARVNGAAPAAKAAVGSRTPPAGPPLKPAPVRTAPPPPAPKDTVRRPVPPAVLPETGDPPGRPPESPPAAPSAQETVRRPVPPMVAPAPTDTARAPLLRRGRDEPRPKPSRAVAAPAGRRPGPDPSPSRSRRARAAMAVAGLLAVGVAVAAVVTLTSGHGPKPGRNLGVIGPTVSQPSPPPANASIVPAPAASRHRTAHRKPKHRAAASTPATTVVAPVTAAPTPPAPTQVAPVTSPTPAATPAPQPNPASPTPPVTRRPPATGGGGTVSRPGGTILTPTAPPASTAPNPSTSAAPPIPTTITLPNASNTVPTGSPPTTP